MGTEENDIYGRGKCQGNRVTKTILGNKEHKSVNFRCLGIRESMQLAT